MSISTIIISVVTIVVLVASLKMYLQDSELVQVKSGIDGRTYLVRDLKDKYQAADQLAKIRANLIKIVKYMDEKFPDDPRVKRMIKNFDPNVISEGIPDVRYTSYSVNKGSKIVFCVRQRDQNNSLVDMNTMSFVAIHELSHLATKSIGHTIEFWENMSFLLKSVLESPLNVYTYQPYHTKPQEYCGTQVSDTPFKINSKT